jgi:hypothetical protein
LGLPLRTFDTVATDTPTAAAMSFTVVMHHWPEFRARRDRWPEGPPAATRCNALHRDRFTASEYKVYRFT